MHSMTAYSMTATVWEVKLKVAGEYKVETNKEFLEGTPEGPMMGEKPSAQALQYVETLLAACSWRQDLGGRAEGGSGGDEGASAGAGTGGAGGDVGEAPVPRDGDGDGAIEGT